MIHHSLDRTFRGRRRGEREAQWAERLGPQCAVDQEGDRNEDNGSSLSQTIVEAKPTSPILKTKETGFVFVWTRRPRTVLATGVAPVES